MEQIDLLASIERAFKERADQPFHFSAEERLTYRELAEQSTKLAGKIAAQVERGMPILVHGHKSIYLSVAYLACIQSGNPYVPIDTSTPKLRTEKIASEVGAKFLLNTTDSTVGIEGCDEFFLNQESISRLIANPTRRNAVAPEEVLYILFTSGSSGVPKGVQVTRGNVEDFLLWTVNEFHYGESPKSFLNQAPFNFDLSIYEFYNALTTGGTIFSLLRAEIEDLPTLYRRLFTFGKDLNVWVSTPSFLNLALVSAEFNQSKFPHLEHAVVIGEVLQRKTATLFLERFPAAKLFNFYGPTEATVATTVCEITKEILAEYPVLPIGTSKPRSNISILENEIVITGPNVAKGYINPGSGEPKFFLANGRHSYKTGDLGYFNEKGLLFFSGRKDFQVKVNGFRVELEELEVVLREIPGVLAGAVRLYRSEGGIDSLLAIVQMNSEWAGKENKELKAYIQTEFAKKVPPYMIPRKCLAVEQIPLNLNGKIDRDKLAAIV